MQKNSKILVLGARGMVGSSLMRALAVEGYTSVLGPGRDQLDLMSQSQTLTYFEKHQPDFVFMAAAKVGGIVANNTYRADFIFQNLQIQNHAFEAAFRNKVKKFLFLGSSCIYPKEASQPMKEDCLLTGALEPTNEPYAIAKIAGVKMGENFRRQYGVCYFSAMPTNLYGTNDNYHLENSHVIPGLIARMHQAKKCDDKTFLVWGTGKPRREFLHVDDLAQACLLLMNLPDDQTPDLTNVGSGEDVPIGELAEMIRKALDFQGKIEFDTTRPDGTARKLLDISQIRSLGWSPRVTLQQGIAKTVSEYLSTSS